MDTENGMNFKINLFDDKLMDMFTGIDYCWVWDEKIEKMIVATSAKDFPKAMTKTKMCADILIQIFYS
jgi:hypothetical protein